MLDSQSPAVNAGACGAYEWLTTFSHDFDNLLTLCPTTVLGKYVAVTSFDSGSLDLSSQEKAAGWGTRSGIAYSPLIESVGALPERGGFDEWYVFGAPVDLGEKGQGNIFEAPLLAGQVEVFVNFGEASTLTSQTIISCLCSGVNSNGFAPSPISPIRIFS